MAGGGGHLKGKLFMLLLPWGRVRRRRRTSLPRSRGPVTHWDWWSASATNARPDNHRSQRAAPYPGANIPRPWDIWLRKVCQNPRKPGGPLSAWATDTFRVIAPWPGLAGSGAFYPARWPFCEPSSAGPARPEIPLPVRPRILARHPPPPAWALLGVRDVSNRSTSPARRACFHAGRRPRQPAL